MWGFDDCCSRCKTNDAVVYDYVTKKISCSDCGLEFANTEPNNASSSDGDILKNLGFDPLAVATTQQSNAPSDHHHRFYVEASCHSEAKQGLKNPICSTYCSGRSPSSVAASVVYIIAQLSHEKRVLLKDIKDATGVHENTIRLTYKDLYPYLSRIVPTLAWFANENDLKKLRSP
ncbi:hypothetical protein HID58_014103 [Brassica napus]|uniref:Transcription factor TFIIB cyclin-like domain-containing protein n=1 Tax=Brassica napus TaxID=3708 RepID=A0ABQ8DGC1_BRANA|nr:hypothetical protein HID58_014103 [Brassica napus]